MIRCFKVLSNSSHIILKRLFQIFLQFFGHMIKNVRENFLKLAKKFVITLQPWLNFTKNVLKLYSAESCILLMEHKYHCPAYFLF